MGVEYIGNSSKGGECTSIRVAEKISEKRHEIVAESHSPRSKGIIQFRVEIVTAFLDFWLVCNVQWVEAHGLNDTIEENQRKVVGIGDDPYFLHVCYVLMPAEPGTAPSKVAPIHTRYGIQHVDGRKGCIESGGVHLVGYSKRVFAYPIAQRMVSSTSTRW